MIKATQCVSLPKRPEPDQSGMRRTFAIGKFDGLHLGHQAIILLTVEQARLTNTIPCIFCFDPHPRFVLTGDGSYQSWLTPPNERAQVAESYGIKETYVAKFDETFRSQTAREFIESYLVALGAKVLIVGDDFHFGKNGAYDVDDVKVIGESLGITVHVVSKIQDENEPVSSSRIRKCLLQGDIQGACRLLNRPYKICATVVHGQHLGRTIGFPTANLVVTEPYVLPREGVYAVKSMIDEKKVLGVMNIGRRPTVTRENALRLEVHFPDLVNVDLYEKTLCIEFDEFLREEQQFSSLDMLRQQLTRDVEHARDVSFT